MSIMHTPHVTEREVDVLIFGECQSLLYNYENLLIEIFGEEYALNESLAFSLQFSYMRTGEQRQANRSVLSAELREVRSYIENYRSNLSEDIFNSQEYSVKLIQVPIVSNTNRNDIAIDFVRWDELDSASKERYQQIVTLIKDRKEWNEGKNVGRLLPGKVVEKVKAMTHLNFNFHHHRYIYTIFSVRPPGRDPNPGETNTKYCHYDFANENYAYQESWVDFIVKLFEVYRLTIEEIHLAYKIGEKWDINQYS